MKNWWKYLSVALLLYVIVVSLNTPLGPGLTAVSPENLNTGENSEIKVIGYNTHFRNNPPDMQHPGVWLESDGFHLTCNNVEVIDDQELHFSVEVPDELPSKSLHVFVSYDEGTFMLPNAFRAEQSVKNDQLKNEAPESFSGSVTAFYFPNREILRESIRNLMFHVPMWFTMMLLMTISVVYSIKYLSGLNPDHDLIARQAVNVGLLFGILGLLTGSLWARFTWGQWWVSDTKLNGAAITTLIYFAYTILRGSINEEQNKARVAAVYNVFAYVILIVLLMVLPRLTDSLHPGNGGNPAFSSYDLDNALRTVFYPAVLGWMGISLWILQLRNRTERIKQQIENA